MAQIFKIFEENDEYKEEEESLSFVCRSLKNLSFADFVFALQRMLMKITNLERHLETRNHMPAQYIIGMLNSMGCS